MVKQYILLQQLFGLVLLTKRMENNPFVGNDFLTGFLEPNQESLTTIQPVPFHGSVSLNCVVVMALTRSTCSLLAINSQPL